MKTKRAVLLDPVLRLRFLLVFSICCQPGSQKYLESLEWTPQNPKWVNNPLFFKSIAVMLLSCKQVSSVREQHDRFLLQLPVRLQSRWSNLLIINAVWLEKINYNNNGIYIARIHRCSKRLNLNNQVVRLIYVIIIKIMNGRVLTVPNETGRNNEDVEFM